MSSPNMSNALAPSGQSSAIFTQQGSLDWVALGQMQYSASIAILGRLAKAGIDTLTVAFGQAMCARLPIGAHGEKVLAKAMEKLTAKSCAGDLLWFGIGVRHILRELVQTSQGCSLVALSAALTESHSIPVSALVLYEIAKECGSPVEFAPSFEQWEALVRVAASVFNATTFGLRIHQIAKFGDPGSGSWPSSSHPYDLAKTLLSIGQVIHGSTQSISVQGNRSCSWLAAWADFVLGLRVMVRDTNGSVVYANYDIKETFAQININFLADESTTSIVCINSSHLIRSGAEFIRQCFGREKLIASNSSDLVFSCGRVQRDTMFSDTFGESFKSLVRKPRQETSAQLPIFGGVFRLPTAGLLTNQNGDEGIFAKRAIFVEIVAISAAIFVAKGVTTMHHRSAASYILHACQTVPELCQCKEDLLMAVTNAKDSNYVDIQSLYNGYLAACCRLRNLCGCQRHRDQLQPSRNEHCLIALTETLVFLTFLFDRLIMDTPLMPTFYGLQLIFDQFERARWLPGETIKDDHKLDIFSRLTRVIEEGCAPSFEVLACLFSGAGWNPALHRYIAQSDGKIYCYIHPIEELTDSIERASLVHIGSGAIEYRTRHYRAIYDDFGESEPQPRYPAEGAEVVDNIDYLAQDTTSDPIEAQVLVEERPNALYFRYQINSPSGRTLVAPSTLLEHLKMALAYKGKDKVHSFDMNSWLPVLRGFQYILVHGEGVVDESDKCHVLRPLRGNVLGRCVAISNTKKYAALIKTESELELFARFWAQYRDECLAIGNAPHYYVLIS